MVGKEPFKTYTCSVTPTDCMRVYVTEAECKDGHMALVMSNQQGQKISVLLTRDAAIELQNQFNDFIINS